MKILLPLLALPLLTLGPALAHSTGPAGPLDETGWRTDRAWYDGLAEKCTYEATRTIYALERSYVATAYTNKERASSKVTVKDDGGDVEVFKHHWSERVPTENYDYDFSTMTYTRASDLTPFKLTASTQDDCGASFKELWRDGGRLRYLESVYFPGTGRRDGIVRGDADDVVLADALTLTLRDFPFDAPRDLELTVVPSQKSTKPVPYDPEKRVARHAGRQTLQLPVGAVDAHRIDLVRPDRSVEASYWFAADGTAPWLHALVQYEGPEGITYRLKTIERTAYWRR